MDLSSLLARENRKLERCRIAQRGERLYLRATLPGRLDAATRCRTAIALGLMATPAGLRQAVALARQLDDELSLACFDWAHWSPEALAARAPAGTAAVQRGGSGPDFEALAAAVEALYGRKYPGLPRSSTTAWGKKYAPVLKLLATATGPVTDARLAALLRSVPSPSSRKSSASILRQAVVQLGWPLDRQSISEAGSGYGRREISPRDIPSDETIESYIDQIELPHWRWLYGMVWLFGIRPHEITGAELERRDGRYVLHIDEDTKTGARESWAFPDSKVEQYGLQHVHRPPQDKFHVTTTANLYLCSAKSDGRGGRRRPRLPFSLYNLRHAYAIRLLVAGWPAELGARLMGHSVQQHTETYQRWVNQQHMKAMHSQFRNQLG